MEEKDWIFEKWPVWLRWICVLPLAVLASFILPILSRLSLLYVGYDLNSGLGKTIVQYASLAGFLAIIYTCTPKFKEIITGIISILFSILFAIDIYLLIAQDDWSNWDFFIYILMFVGCLIFSVCVFIEHGRLSRQNEFNDKLNNYSSSYYIDSEDIEE